MINTPVRTDTYIQGLLRAVLPYWLSDRKFPLPDSRLGVPSIYLFREGELAAHWRKTNRENHEAWRRMSYQKLQWEQHQERKRLRQIATQLKEVKQQIGIVEFGQWPQVCQAHEDLFMEYLILRDRCLLRRKIFRYKWDRVPWYNYQDTNTNEVLLAGLLTVIRGPKFRV